MGNLQTAGRMRLFKHFNAALLKPLKFGHFTEKSTKSVVKISTLPLDMTF
jgi:hypothetical protein